MSRVIGKMWGSADNCYNTNILRFFTALDWEDVLHKGLKPPIVPEEGKLKKC